MCGIAGGTGPDSPERRAVLQAQLQTLQRRGPDSAGFLPGTRGAVGQTRLAVIDVEGGDPPLTDESGLITVALNGEIYNHRLLRDRLEREGHRFRTRCDTEVLAHLAEELEPVELARQLDGMFAFALWDERTGTLTLGRDRLGKKPLHYWSDGEQVVFGSEIKAVLADPRVPRRLEDSVIGPYLAFGYAPTPLTFFQGVRSLPPGAVLVARQGAAPEVRSYWDPSEADGPRRTEPTEVLARELRSHLRSAVEKRLVADVPLGAFLSGGVDSSAVVGLMTELGAGPVRTFCIGFEEAAYDEREYAARVARRFGAVHLDAVVKPDAGSLLEDVLTACDQPFADSSALPTLLLSRLTREHVTVALSGDGGDELFAGYERFAAAAALQRLERVSNGLLRAGAAAAGAAQRLHPTARKAQRLLTHAPRGLPDAYTAWVQVFEPAAIDDLRPGDGVRALRTYDDVWEQTAGATTVSRILDLNLRTYLLDDLLVKVDRTSMACGLEVRSPLLDVELLGFARRVPDEEHLRGRQLKRLFKAAVADLLPPEIVNRPKKGFGVPLDAWFRGELRAEARGALLSPRARVAHLLDPVAVRRVVDGHAAGQPFGQRLWSLLMLERFLERQDWG